VPLELLRGQARETLERHLVGGVVDEDVHTAELVDGPLHDLLTGGLVLDVAWDEHRSASRLLHPASRLLGVGLLGLEVRQHHVGPLTGEGDRDRPPDARVAAGDDRATVTEAPGPAIGLLAVVRLHLHVDGATGMLDRHVGEVVGVVLLGRVLLRVLVVGHVASPSGGVAVDRAPRTVTLKTGGTGPATWWSAGRYLGAPIDPLVVGRSCIGVLRRDQVDAVTVGRWPEAHDIDEPDAVRDQRDDVDDDQRRDGTRQPVRQPEPVAEDDDADLERRHAERRSRPADCPDLEHR
jgi:hypothetical protein